MLSLIVLIFVLDFSRNKSTKINSLNSIIKNNKIDFLQFYNVFVHDLFEFSCSFELSYQLNNANRS